MGGVCAGNNGPIMRMITAESSHGMILFEIGQNSSDVIAAMGQEVLA
ncbi:hypothetical protein NPIL_189581, partial [Nephila pilipes]